MDRRVTPRQVEAPARDGGISPAAAAGGSREIGMHQKGVSARLSHRCRWFKSAFRRRCFHYAHRLGLNVWVAANAMTGWDGHYETWECFVELEGGKVVARRVVPPEPFFGR